MASRWLFMLLCLSIQNEVSCGIFAGAIFMWEATGNATEITINAHIAWNRSLLPCDLDTVTNDSSVGSVGLSCLSGCSKAPEIFSFGCSAFNETIDWATGSGSVLYTPDSDVFSFGLKNSLWTEHVNGASTLRHVTKANVTIRSDTGRINKPPNIDIPLFLTIKHGCNHSIGIPVTDADGDVVRCRFASPNNTDGLDECGSICYGFQAAGATIDPDTCTINYLADDGNVWFGVPIQVEDFVEKVSQSPLSSTAVQLIISVLGTSSQCPEMMLGEACQSTVIKPCSDPNTECSGGTCQCQHGYYDTNGTCEPRASNSEGHSDSDGFLLGVSVTVPVALVGVVIILLTILFLRRRKRQRDKQTHDTISTQNQIQGSFTSAVQKVPDCNGKEPKPESSNDPSNRNGHGTCYVVFDGITGGRGAKDKSIAVEYVNLSDDFTNCHEITLYDSGHVYSDLRKPPIVVDHAYQSLQFPS